MGTRRQLVACLVVWLAVCCCCAEHEHATTTTSTSTDELPSPLPPLPPSPPPPRIHPSAHLYDHTQLLQLRMKYSHQLRQHHHSSARAVEPPPAADKRELTASNYEAFAAAHPTIYVGHSRIENCTDIGSASCPYEYIQDAIDSAAANTTIIVQPGDYVETVRFSKDLVLIGEDRERVRLACAKPDVGYAVMFTNTSQFAVLANLTITKCGVDISGASPVIDRVTFTAMSFVFGSHASAALAVHPDFTQAFGSRIVAQPVLNRCVFTKLSTGFVVLVENATLSVFNTSFISNTPLVSLMEIRHSVVEMADSDVNANDSLFHQIVVSSLFGRTIVRILNCRFTNNTASSGSAFVSLGDSDVAIKDTSFIHNWVQPKPPAPDLQELAGVIVIQHVETLLTHMSKFELIRCTFRENFAPYASALLITGVVTAEITNCTISHNVARTRSVVLLPKNSTISISGSTFTEGFGGCLMAQPPLSIESSVFEHCGGRHLAGGAILMQSGSQAGVLALSNVHFYNNTARSGGAVALETLTAVPIIAQIDRCKFINNTASIFGGALTAISSVQMTLTNSEFISNTAQLGDGGAVFLAAFHLTTIDNVLMTNNLAIGNGGGVSGHSRCTISRSVFLYNTGSFGGGVVLAYPNSTLSHSNLHWNNATRNGGGLSCLSRGMVINNVTITENSARNAGGGVEVIFQADVSFYNSTVSSNRAVSKGGGIVIYDSIVRFQNSLICNNSATSSAGISVQEFSTLYINSTLFQGNQADAGGAGIGISEFGQLYIADSQFEHNRGFAGNGGAIVVVDFALLQIERSTFTSNAAKSGGALFTSSYEKTTIYDCDFIQNQATGGSGGALMLVNTSISMQDCTFRGNLAIRSGGGVSIQDTTTAWLNALLFANNSAGNFGGGMQIVDRSRVHMNFTKFHDNRAAVSGGGLHVANGDDLQLTESLFKHNTAHFEKGGGIHITCSNANITGVEFEENVSVDGGGMAISLCPIQLAGSRFVLLNFTYLQFLYNNATNGGALALMDANSCVGIELYSEQYVPTDSDAMWHALQNASPSNSSDLASKMLAQQFGVSSTPLTTHQELARISGEADEEVYASSTGTATFQHIQMMYNRAKTSGGAILRRVSSLPYAAGRRVPFEFRNAVSIQSNSALYGGALFVTTEYGLTEPWMYGVLFVDNFAYNGGGAVALPAFRALKQHNTTSGFCVGCHFDNNTAPYQTKEGFATPPFNASYTEDCDPSLLITNQFNMSIRLQDAFGTQVHGNIYANVGYSAKLLPLTNTDCQLYQLDVPVAVAIMANFSADNDGSVTIDDLSFKGRQGANCTSILQVTADTLVPTHRIPLLKCASVLYGCPPGKKVKVGQTYDTCEVKQLNDMAMLVLAILITALVVTILAVMITYCTNSLLRRYRRYKLSKMEIPDLERKALLTIAEIVGDPNINHIPWSQLEIKERLGAGAGGVVSRAIWHREIRKMFQVEVEDKVVAVKSMYQSLDMSEAQTRQFLAEIKILSHLEHPNIVQFLGVSCPNHEEIVIITELMERGSVRDLLTKKGANIPWAVRLRWARDAATGVQYLHQRSFIHRDIKPGNFLVNRNWRVKIADFGISTIKRQHASVTMTVIGTPVYMAPEVLRGYSYSEKADVYSFGISLVELYTSKTPYDEDRFRKVTKMDLLSMICNGTRPDISALPAPLRLLVEDCWDNDPTLRPSFDEVILRLGRMKRLTVGGGEPPSSEHSANTGTDTTVTTNGHDDEDDDELLIMEECDDLTHRTPRTDRGHHTEHQQLLNVTEELRNTM